MKFTDKATFLLASLGRLLDSVKGMPMEDTPQISAGEEILPTTAASPDGKDRALAFSGTLEEEGTWTETFHTSDGDDIVVSATVKRINDLELAKGQEEVGYGCARVEMKASRKSYTIEQHTEACMSGTVTRAEFTKVEFTEDNGMTNYYVLEDRVYEYFPGLPVFKVGADFDEYGNVIMKSVFAWTTSRENPETTLKYQPFQTTFYGYGAWHGVLLDPVYYYDKNLQVRGRLRPYHDGSFANKPSPWVLNPGTTILLTSDPSKTSENGFVALAEPDFNGQFLSWDDGTTGDRTVTVTMNEFDPWQTDTIVQARFEDSQEINTFDVDHSQSHFMGAGVHNHGSIPGYVDELGCTRFERIIFWSGHSWQLDVFKMVITPTGEATDLDLYLDDSGGGGWPNENIYNPSGTYDAATKTITLSMDTDHGAIHIVVQDSSFVCGEVEEQCESSAQSCEGTFCDQGTCQAPFVCGEVDEQCESSSDCCDGNVCNQFFGTCQALVCVAVDQQCEYSLECCDGNACNQILGTCQATNMSLRINAECTANGDCWSERCTNGYCDPNENNPNLGADGDECEWDLACKRLPPESRW
eukprot:Clim_evm51s99 gene=Clim_evmTU51s99